MTTTTVEKKVYKPAPFQQEDLEFLCNRDWSANWSDMGCYKTTTLEWLLECKLKGIKNPKVLIVTTKSGKGTYFQTLPEVLPNWGIYNLTGKKISYIFKGFEMEVEQYPDKPANPIICITHYNVFTKRKKPKKKKSDPNESSEQTLESIIAQMQKEAKAKTKKSDGKNVLDALLKTHWDFIALDEAHRIKGRHTGWTKNIKKLKGPRRHIMTGTGFINNPVEVWSLLNFLNKSLFASEWKFRQRYCLEENVNGYNKIIGIKPETKKEFQELVRSIGPRRTKREVFPNLKEPIYTPVSVELNTIQQAMYNQIRDSLQAMDQAGEAIFAPGVLAALTRLRQICVATPHKIRQYYDEDKERMIQEIELVEPSSKLDAVMDLLDGLHWDEDGKDQVVIFSCFRDPLKLLEARLEKAGISYLHMKTEDNDRVRYQKWAEEFPKKNHQVFMSTLQLGSESISLTSAETVIFLDRSWSPKDNLQGESRVWRPGQGGVANIIHINAENTTDWYIEGKNEIKTGWFREIFG